MTSRPNLLTLATLSLLMAPIVPLLAADASPPPPPAEQKQDQQHKPTDSSEATHFWLRLVKVDMPKDSPLREDKQFNDPPCVYVAYKSNGQKTRYSTKHYGWSVSFPDDLDYNQVLVTADKDNEYTFEVWDSQYRSNKQLFSVGPLPGSVLEQQLAAPDQKDPSKPRLLVLSSKDTKAALTFAFGGTRVYYRLTNITLPPESSHRKTLTSPPRLYLILKIDGKQLGDYSTIHPGWSVDLSNEARNCWFIREGSPNRYSIEVWNAQGIDSLLFTITGISGTDFRSPLKESVDKLLGPDVAATVHFERCDPPSE